MNPIKRAMLEYWGERCDDYEEGCPVCDAWREYDNLVRVVRSTYLDADGNYYPDADFNDAVRDALAQLKKELK